MVKEQYLGRDSRMDCTFRTGIQFVDGAISDGRVVDGVANKCSSVVLSLAAMMQVK